MTETAANSIKYSVLSLSQPDENWCAWSSSTAMEVNGNSKSYARSKFVFAYICPSVLYFPEVGQIQHGAIKYENKSTL